MPTDLSRINWDFADAGTLSGSPHSVHWFPGNFIPQIPSFLIQIMTDKSELVLDPFCGSGTTGLEAGYLGRRSIQVDMNRMSVTIAEAKLLSASTEGLVSAIDRFARDMSLHATDLFVERSPIPDAIQPESSDRGGWYHVNTLRQLTWIWARIRAIHDPALNNVLRVIFSDTLFAAAAERRAVTRSGGTRRHHWGWIADNVRPRSLTPHDAIDLFLDRAARAAYACGKSRRFDGACHAVVQGDVRSLPLAANSADAIITSPPYLGMIDYARANRLSYMWFGWDFERDMRGEIGARFKRSRRNAEVEYLADMDVAARELSRVLKRGRHCALVIGSSRKFPSAVLSTIALFERYMSRVWGPTKRRPTRRRVAERRGTDATEFIVVFRNEK